MPGGDSRSDARCRSSSSRGRVPNCLRFPALARPSLSSPRHFGTVPFKKNATITSIYNILETIKVFIYIYCRVLCTTIAVYLEPSSEVPAMALSYCRRHQRLFSPRCARWVSFSPATMDELRRYYALVRATEQEAASRHVLDLACDQCPAILPTLARSNAEEAWGAV